MCVRREYGYCKISWTGPTFSWSDKVTNQPFSSLENMFFLSPTSNSMIFGMVSFISRRVDQIWWKVKQDVNYCYCYCRHLYNVTIRPQRWRPPLEKVIFSVLQQTLETGFVFSCFFLVREKIDRLIFPGVDGFVPLLNGMITQKSYHQPIISQSSRWSSLGLVVDAGTPGLPQVHHQLRIKSSASDQWSLITLW